MLAQLRSPLKRPAGGWWALQTSLRIRGRSSDFASDCVCARPLVPVSQIAGGSIELRRSLLDHVAFDSSFIKIWLDDDGHIDGCPAARPARMARPRIKEAPICLIAHSGALQHLLG